MDTEQHIASELRLRPEQVKAALELLKQGATVPFIAQYRREKTGNLDERRLSTIQEKLRAIDELDARRSVILNSIKAQDKLDPALQSRIESVTTRGELEDLYLPFGPQKKSPAETAKEKGLEPLADLIQKQETTSGDPEEIAAPFLSAEKGVKEVQEALTGAQHIVADRLASDLELRKTLRKRVRKDGVLTATARRGVDLNRSKYKEFSQAANQVSSNKMLPLLRGVADRKLVLKIQVPREQVLSDLKPSVVTKSESVFSANLEKALEEAVDKLLLPGFENEYLEEITARAESTALDQCARNLRATLLHPPLGPRTVLTIAGEGKKAVGLAIVDAYGKLVKGGPFVLEEDPEKRKALSDEFLKLLAENEVDTVAVGNGPSGRRIYTFVAEVLQSAGLDRQGKALVNETGLSAVANAQPAKEAWPDAEPLVRCAALLARRLQDPLPELIKVNPKLLVSGASQLSIDAKTLRRRLDDAIASCVNAVGVDVNASDARLLEYVSGLNGQMAKAIVAKRDEKGSFKAREELKSVPGINEAVFAQCAGFLRVSMGSEPLDSTAIHPERYELVRKMAESVESKVEDLMGNTEALGKIEIGKFKSEDAGENTLRHILRELRLNGRDPRGRFLTPRYDARIKSIEDIQPGQVLTGIVTNHSAFGVFLDIGIAEEGLVHVTELSRRQLHDPARFLPVGKLAKVKVISADAQKKRISLSIKAMELEEKDRRGGRRPGSSAQRRAVGRSGPQDRERSTQGDQGQGASGGGERGRKGGGRDRDRTSREAAKYPTVSASGKPMPDFSKFFASGSKKKDKRKKKDGRRDEGASRKEILEVIRNQANRSAPTLGDLLKEAGVKEDEKKKS